MLCINLNCINFTIIVDSIIAQIYLKFEIIIKAIYDQIVNISIIITDLESTFLLRFEKLADKIDSKH